MSSSDINYTAYKDHADDYLAKNLDGITGGLNPKERVNNFKKYLTSGKILEIGSGQGLDAIELQNQGFHVIASDFVDSFLDILKSRNFEAVKINLKNSSSLKFFENLDGVYANAVFVHFSPSDFEQALAQIHAALNQNGVLFFSVLIGSGTEISNRMNGVEREFFYYSKEDIEKLLIKNKFSILELNENVEGRWIHCFVIKNP